MPQTIEPHPAPRVDARGTRASVEDAAQQPPRRAAHLEDALGVGQRVVGVDPLHGRG